jgi:hypothetical protein
VCVCAPSLVLTAACAADAQAAREEARAESRVPAAGVPFTSCEVVSRYKRLRPAVIAAVARRGGCGGDYGSGVYDAGRHGVGSAAAALRLLGAAAAAVLDEAPLQQQQRRRRGISGGGGGGCGGVVDAGSSCSGAGAAGWVPPMPFVPGFALNRGGGGGVGGGCGGAFEPPAAAAYPCFSSLFTISAPPPLPPLAELLQCSHQQVGVGDAPAAAVPRIILEAAGAGSSSSGGRLGSAVPGGLAAKLSVTKV